MFMFLCFFNWPGDLKHLGSGGQQADKYIAPGGKFFMFFMYLILPMNQVKIPQFFRRGIRVPLYYLLTMSLVEIRLLSYFQNNMPVFKR